LQSTPGDVPGPDNHCIATWLPDARQLLNISFFVLDRRQIIAEAVPPLRIVEPLDEVEDILLCLFTSAISLGANPFPLWQLEESLGNGIIVAVTA
jgi:hypothetical protein